jgi:hypothetical protein
MKRQVLYELATGKVLMEGYQDFASGGTYDATLHGIVENDTYSFPDLPVDLDTGEENLIYWNGTEFTLIAL